MFQAQDRKWYSGSSFKWGLTALTTFAIAAGLVEAVRTSRATLGPVDPIAPNQLLVVQPSPKATFDAHTGEVSIVEFVLQNITSEPVKLLGANSECTCALVTNQFPIEIRGGGEERIKVRVKIGQPDSTGKITRKILLLANRAGIL